MTDENNFCRMTVLSRVQYI